METIILAAICAHENVIAIGKRHDDIAHDISKLSNNTMYRYSPGFITSTGRFVDRAEAKEIAIKSGQITESEFPQLYSEDLW